ncbi:hypothetical protein DFJ74DRAFT_696020 [Hyaloraphidium curvatum]|nr:hypothetical protein DFJ74DRAFT_696020 [Hyaloraphidium curvatum]
MSATEPPWVADLRGRPGAVAWLRSWDSLEDGGPFWPRVRGRACFDAYVSAIDGDAVDAAALCGPFAGGNGTVQGGASYALLYEAAKQLAASTLPGSTMRLSSTKYAAPVPGGWLRVTARVVGRKDGTVVIDSAVGADGAKPGVTTLTTWSNAAEDAGTVRRNEVPVKGMLPALEAEIGDGRAPNIVVAMVRSLFGSMPENFGYDAQGMRWHDLRHYQKLVSPGNLVYLSELPPGISNPTGTIDLAALAVHADFTTAGTTWEAYNKPTAHTSITYEPTAFARSAMPRWVCARVRCGPLEGRRAKAESVLEDEEGRVLAKVEATVAVVGGEFRL